MVLTSHEADQNSVVYKVLALDSRRDRSGEPEVYWRVQNLDEPLPETSGSGWSDEDVAYEPGQVCFYVELQHAVWDLLGREWDWPWGSIARTIIEAGGRPGLVSAMSDYEVVDGPEAEVTLFWPKELARFDPSKEELVQLLEQLGEEYEENPKGDVPMWAEQTTFRDAMEGGNTTGVLGTLWDGGRNPWKIRLKRDTHRLYGDAQFLLRDGEGHTDRMYFNLNPNDTIAQILEWLQEYFRAGEQSSKADMTGLVPVRIEAADTYDPPAHAKKAAGKRAKEGIAVRKAQTVDQKAFKSRFGRVMQDADRADWETIKRLEGPRHLTHGGEITLDRARRRLSADMKKWRVGQGAGWMVTPTQTNRGFRIVELRPEERSVVIRSVADTGLTVTGGDRDYIRDQVVSLIDLVRDKRYDSRE